MLIKYEYELLSNIVLNGISKANGDIIVPFKRIEDELLEDNIDKYLNLLELRGIIELYEDKLVISINEWIDFFIEQLSNMFDNNNMSVICKKKIEKNEFYIEFLVNGSVKEFMLMFNNIDNFKGKKDLIFMCRPRLYEDNIYWFELINNINLTYQFYSYLINEINNINKLIYREINLFEGIDEKHIVEIFDVAIKNYFKRKEYNIISFDKESSKFINTVFYNSDILCFGVKIDDETLWVIKKQKKIGFISLKDEQLTYSEKIDEVINQLEEKISNKVSEFKKLTFFKENNIVDTNLKIVEKATTFFVPTSTIISILALMGVNTKLKVFTESRPILIIIIIFLLVIQFYLVKVIYLPTFKLSKFNWNIN